MDNRLKEILEKIDDAIGKLNKKDFTINFFVVDTKGVPNGNTRYIYEMAKELIDNDYNCFMLYQQEKETVEFKVFDVIEPPHKKQNGDWSVVVRTKLNNEFIDKIKNGTEIEIRKNKIGYTWEEEIEVPFIGVRDWMGDDFADIPHGSIGSETIKVSTSDFLIIPELFANVMNQTKKLPCKRIVLCQNLNFITEFISLGTSWANFGITDVITTTEIQAEEIKDLFPGIKSKVINPFIPSYFRNNSDPKKMVIATIIKDTSLLKKLVNQFYWKYPEYSWVTFMDLRNLSRESFANTLRESAITVWMDDDTYFGHTPVEAIKSGSIVIGKIPTTIPEWMYSEDKTELSTNGLWFDNFKNVHKLIAQAIKLWLDDEIPAIVTDEMVKMNDKYTVENNQTQLLNAIKEYTSERIVELTDIKNKIEK